MSIASEELYFAASADFHAGRIPPEKLAAVFRAIGGAGASGAHFFIAAGDVTDTGAPGDYDKLAALVTRLDLPFYPVMGNHEFYTEPGEEAKARFTRTFGLEAPSYMRIMDGVPFVFLSTDRDINGCRVAISDSLPLLEKALGEGEGPLFVVCHAPLSGTVGGVPDRPCFVSDDPEFGLTESDAVRALVAEAGRSVVWISGHTHPPLGAENLIMTEWLDGHPLHSVNLTCPYFTSRDFGMDDPITFYHFRVRPTACVVEIRDIASGEARRTEMLPLA